MGEDGRRRWRSGLGISCLDRMVSGQLVMFDPEKKKIKDCETLLKESKTLHSTGKPPLKSPTPFS